MNLDSARISGTRVYEAAGQDVQQADIIQESGMDSASDGEIREDGHAVRPLEHVSLDIVLPPDFAVSDMVAAFGALVGCPVRITMKGSLLAADDTCVRIALVEPPTPDAGSVFRISLLE
ncbi:hypothetical protein EUX98_g8341 [Antrodiella citrinella]|uniref:Uncharacterized protein n=1 Tax=Antrodiella citrinella TaxID=2447956 RepID=A0A4S4MEQ0_9APHY|nr:hypothetical protein EUX98_g8341 [Antrodiella citrinella]